MEPSYYQPPPLSQNSDSDKLAPKKVGPREALEIAFKKRSVLAGRASRSEYWWFVFDYWIIVLGFLAVDAALAHLLPTGSLGHTLISLSLWAQRLFFLLVLWITLSLAIRRLHDAGYSGAFLFFVFIPIVLFVFLCLPSSRVENEYGPAAIG